MIKKILDMIFPPPNYARLIEKFRFDEHTSFFRVGREEWRFVHKNKFIDVNMEAHNHEWYLDKNSVRHWKPNPLERFDIYLHSAEYRRPKNMSSDEVDFVVDKIKQIAERRKNRLEVD